MHKLSMSVKIYLSKESETLIIIQFLKGDD